MLLGILHLWKPPNGGCHLGAGKSHRIASLPLVSQNGRWCPRKTNLIDFDREHDDKPYCLRHTPGSSKIKCFVFPFRPYQKEVVWSPNQFNHQRIDRHYQRVILSRILEGFLHQGLPRHHGGFYTNLPCPIDDKIDDGTPLPLTNEYMCFFGMGHPLFIDGTHFHTTYRWSIDGGAYHHCFGGLCWSWMPIFGDLSRPSFSPPKWRGCGRRHRPNFWPCRPPPKKNRPADPVDHLSPWTISGVHSIF